MADDSFIERYTKDEKIKLGIEAILKSDKYTDEYKALILKYLGENYSAPTEINTTAEEQAELMDKGGLVIEEGKTGLIRITDKKPAVRGRIETPKYIESELVKAIDIVVDELISPPPKKSPPTVPLQTYLDLEALYSASVVETEDFRERWLLATDELNTALAQIELLNQSLDACEIQRAVAENQADVINSRYISLLGDFQSAIQKAIQEAIERVSLTAQVRGLQAQKESLKAQLDILQLTLVGSTAESSATAAGLFPSNDSEFFYGFDMLRPNDGFPVHWYTSRDDASSNSNLGVLEVRNLQDNLATLVQIEILDIVSNQTSNSANIMVNQLGPFGFTEAGYGHSPSWNTPNSAPATTKTVSIPAGAAQNINMFINTRIGGRSESPIDPNSGSESRKYYNGTFTLKSTFDDGTVSFATGIKWQIRKDQDD
jgi:hypothetical protein